MASVVSMMKILSSARDTLELVVDQSGATLRGGDGADYGATELEYRLSAEEWRGGAPEGRYSLDLRPLDLGMGSKEWSISMELSSPEESPPDPMPARWEPSPATYATTITDAEGIEMVIMATAQPGVCAPIEVEEMDHVEIVDDPLVFVEKLEWVTRAMSTDGSWENLSSVAFARDGSLVATDGHRLHQDSAGPLSPQRDDPFMLPMVAVQRLLAVIKSYKKACPLIVVGWGKEPVRVPESDPKRQPNDAVRIVIGDWTITATARYGHFPPWEKVVPDYTGEDHIEIAFDQSAASLKKVTAALTKSSKLAMRGGAELVIEGDKLSIRADHPDMGSASVVIPGAVISRHGIDSDLKVRVNPAYLIDAGMGEMSMAVAPPKPSSYDNAKPYPQPILLTSGSRLAVVMPMGL